MGLETSGGSSFEYHPDVYPPGHIVPVPLSPDTVALLDEINPRHLSERDYYFDSVDGVRVSGPSLHRQVELGLEIVVMNIASLQETQAHGGYTPFANELRRKDIFVTVTDTRTGLEERTYWRADRSRLHYMSPTQETYPTEQAELAQEFKDIVLAVHTGLCDERQIEQWTTRDKRVGTVGKLAKLFRRRRND